MRKVRRQRVGLSLFRTDWVQVCADIAVPFFALESSRPDWTLEAIQAPIRVTWSCARVPEAYAVVSLGRDSSPGVSRATSARSDQNKSRWKVCKKCVFFRVRRVGSTSYVNDSIVPSLMLAWSRPCACGVLQVPSMTNIVESYLAASSIVESYLCCRRGWQCAKSAGSVSA